MPHKPEGKTPVSGQYGVIGSRGGRINKGVIAVKGEPMLTTQKACQTYVMNDLTNNKSGKVKNE